MKHIFNIRTQTEQGKLCNKKIFNLKVAGLSILISWPLVPIKTSLKHTANPGTPWIKTCITGYPLRSSLSLAAEAIKANVKIRIKFEENKSIFKNEVSLIAHVKYNLAELYSDLKFESKEIISRLKIQLFGSGQAFQHVAIKHEGMLNCGRFFKLSNWDYDDDNNEKLLKDIDDISLSSMDIIVE